MTEVVGTSTMIGEGVSFPGRRELVVRDCNGLILAFGEQMEQAG